MIQTLCDLCGKPIEREGREFEIKECKGLFDGFFWKEIDAHDECVKMLIQAKQKQEIVTEIMSQIIADGSICTHRI